MVMAASLEGDSTYEPARFTSCSSWGSGTVDGVGTRVRNDNRAAAEPGRARFLRANAAVRLTRGRGSGIAGDRLKQAARVGVRGRANTISHPLAPRSGRRT